MKQKFNSCSSKKIIEECYDKLSREYSDLSHASIQYNEAVETATVLDLLPRDNQPKSFLDVGCGTGRWIKLLHNLGYRDIVGLDLSREMLQVAKRKFGDGFQPLLVHGDAEALSTYFGSGRFDVVVASFCDHILNHRKFFCEIRKVLKRNGFVIASFPSKELSMVLRPRLLNVSLYETRFRLKDGSVYIIPSFVYHPCELENMLSEIGYESIEVREVKAGNCEEIEPVNYVKEVARISKKPVDEIPVVTIVRAESA